VPGAAWLAVPGPAQGLEPARALEPEPALELVRARVPGAACSEHWDRASASAWNLGLALVLAPALE